VVRGFMDDRKRVREDGVPTVFELGDEMKEFDRTFFRAWLTACEDLDTTDNQFEFLNNLAYMYKTEVVNETEGPNLHTRLTPEKMVELSNKVYEFAHSLATEYPK
jgi:hypothetical protein